MRAAFQPLKVISKLTNVNILCLVRFGSVQNKLVQLLILCRNSGSRTVWSLITLLLTETVNSEMLLSEWHRRTSVLCL